MSRKTAVIRRIAVLTVAAALSGVAFAAPAAADDPVSSAAQKVVDLGTTVVTVVNQISGAVENPSGNG